MTDPEALPDDSPLVAEALDALGDTVYLCTPDGDLVYWNDALPTVTGYADAEIDAMTATDFFTADRARVEDAIATTLETGERVTVEADLVTSDGEQLPYEFSGVPLTTDAGRQLVAGVGRNVSERRRNEAELRRQRSELSVMLDNAPVVLFTLDVDGVFTESCGRGLAELGLTDDELVGASIFDVYEDAPVIRENARSALDGSRVREEVTVDGTTFDTIYQPVFDDDGAVERVIGVAVDVTERKERERELERYEAFIENSRDIVMLVDADGTVRYESSAVEQVLGHAPGEHVGDSIFEYFHPEDRAEAVERFAEATERFGPTESIEVRAEAADGSWRWLQAIGTNRLDDPAIRGIVVTARDITERKSYEQELETRNEQLLVLNRIVRHDIRNDMSVSLGWSDLLEDHVDEEGREILDRIHNHDQHVVDLTKTVRDFVETLEDDTDPTLEPIAVERVVDDVLETWTRAYGDAELDVVDVPDAHVDANELLTSVFRNLLNNAVQHNDKETARVRIDGDVREETVVVRIADNGPGIPDDRKDAVFGRSDAGLDDPAAGVGLYLVDTLVAQYGGSVSLDDNDPEGTVAVVELPRA
ncbi:PAS domain-containing sensor histidine kinase [Halobellus sp. Atlit-31R]|nr:PAS domain-containing sensor histidine kinase [Halobellus sp. Atlit-31R]